MASSVKLLMHAYLQSVKFSLVESDPACTLGYSLHQMEVGFAMVACQHWP